MKGLFVVLGFACLASNVASVPIKFPFDEEDRTLDNLLNKLNSIDAEKQDSDIIITFPPIRTTIYPPHWPTTERITTTTTSEPTTTTSKRPRPTTLTTSTTSTTSKPVTTTRRSPNRNPQIFKNIFDTQGPFAGRLYNFVQNFKGNQATKQSNEILYNIKFAKALKRALENDD